jgi:peptidyl-prolyl cis-trans isomerase C
MKATNRRIRSASVAILAAALLAGGCRSGNEGPTGQSAVTSTTVAGGEVVATYKGRKLTSDAVMKEFERLPTPSRTYLNAPDRKRQFVENMIMNDLLFEEGTQAGFDQDADIDRQVNDLRKRLVIQKVMRQYQTPPTVTDEQVRAYYDQNPSLYSTTQIRASHILVKDEETAKQILAELRAHPEKFADLAKAKSTDTTSAQRGGDLGMFGQGRMVPEFERVAFALKPGEISDIVKTQYGYHIITVAERKEGEAKPFEQVKEQIRAMLRNKGLQEQVQGHFDTLKKDAGMKIDDEALARITPPPASAGGPGMGGGHPVPPASGH